LSERKKEDLAEKERVKGNEAIKSKDFDEAISYYTRSIELDSKMYQSYGNRALAYLKKKGTPPSIQILIDVFRTARRRWPLTRPTLRRFIAKRRP
jgi:tetratricopeptide (TPR) repeat protein